MIPSVYNVNSKIDVEETAALIEFARAMEDRPGDMGIIDHVSRSLGGMSIEHGNCVTEDHLAGPLQHNYAYNQLQSYAAGWCPQSLATDIPRLDVASGSTVDQTFSPAGYSDSYASPARSAHACASEGQWVYAYNNYNNFQGQALPDGANFMSYPPMWRTGPALTLELPVEYPATPIMEGDANFCGTPGSSGFEDIEGFENQSIENLSLETPSFEILPEQNGMFFASSSFPEPSQSPTSTAKRSTSPTTSRSHRCRIRSCLMPFKRRAELDRHRESVHQPSSGGYPCPMEGCNRSSKENGFSRKDNLRQHLRLKHDVKLPKGRGNRG